MARTDGGYGVPGMPGNGLAIKDLVYRGEPTQMTPLPYYGGGFTMQPLAGNNPLNDPRFKIQGGEPWNKTPLLPGKETQEYNEQPIDFVPRLPVQNANFGGDGSLIAQAPKDEQGLLQKYLGALINPFGFLKETQDTVNKINERNRKQEEMIRELLGK